MSGRKSEFVHNSQKAWLWAELGSMWNIWYSFSFFFYLNNLFIILKAKVIKQNKPIQNTLATTNRACRILGMNMMFIVCYLLGLDRKKPQRYLGNILFVILYGGSVKWGTGKGGKSNLQLLQYYVR